MQSSALVIAADRRDALPGSPQEMRNGDGSVAIELGRDNIIAEVLTGVSNNTDLVDHYRSQEQSTDYSLEDRWVRDLIAGDIVPATIKRACAQANIEASNIDHLVLPMPAHHAKVVAKKLEVATDIVSDNLYADIGDVGVAHPLLMLAKLLTDIEANRIIALVGVGQGAEVIVLRTTDALSDYVQKQRLSDIFSSDRHALTHYLKLPSFSRQIPLSRGIRAEADKRTALSAHYRNHKVINSMLGSRCTACNTPHFPAARVCVNCHAVDQMQMEPFAHKTATIKSYTEDWQTATPAPPMVYGNVQFDGGGNAFLELTDVMPGDIQVGSELEMQFRIKDFDSRRGFRRYFWKPRPIKNNKHHA